MTSGPVYAHIETVCLPHTIPHGRIDSPYRYCCHGLAWKAAVHVDTIPYGALYVKGSWEKSRTACTATATLICSCRARPRRATRIPHAPCARLSHGPHPHRRGSTHIEGSDLPGWGSSGLRPMGELIYAGLRATVPSMRLAGRHNKAPFIVYAREGGWELERTGSGHVKATRIDEAGTRHMLFLPGTPGGSRSKENALSKLVKCDKGRCHCHLRHPALSVAVG